MDSKNSHNGLSFSNGPDGPRFTDEDLKRLKNAGHLIELARDICGLLARLEAAEGCCDHDTEDCEREFDGCNACRKVKRWRKAKGLSDSEDSAGK